jgi:hypothetical protein
MDDSDTYNNTYKSIKEHLAIGYFLKTLPQIWRIVTSISKVYTYVYTYSMRSFWDLDFAIPIPLIFLFSFSRKYKKWGLKRVPSQDAYNFGVLKIFFLY